ncbi:hypothetical protein V8C86DRAFT_2439943 [Haematococcus lacustris]
MPGPGPLSASFNARIYMMGIDPCRVWDLAKGTCKDGLEGHNEAIGKLTFSSDGWVLTSRTANITRFVYGVLQLQSCPQCCRIPYNTNVVRSDPGPWAMDERPWASWLYICSLHGLQPQGSRHLVCRPEYPPPSRSASSLQPTAAPACSRHPDLPGCAPSYFRTASRYEEGWAGGQAPGAPPVQTARALDDWTAAQRAMGPLGRGGTLTVQELAWATGCEPDTGKLASAAVLSSAAAAPTALAVAGPAGRPCGGGCQAAESQRYDRLLTPRVVAALKARTCKLALTLEQQQAQDSRQYIRLLTEVLKKLARCAAVEACRPGSCKGPSLSPHKTVGCSPKLAQHLMDSFPGLTSLSLHNCAIPCSGLSSLLSHPQLSLQLQQLDLSSSSILQPKRPVPGAATLDNVFHASRLKLLSLLIDKRAGEGNNVLLPNLQPLSQHLTQLCLQQREGVVWGLDDVNAALQPLAQLQVLTMPGYCHLEGLIELLQALPQLHTLQLPGAVVHGQEQLRQRLQQLSQTLPVPGGCFQLGGDRQHLQLSQGLQCCAEPVKAPGCIEQVVQGGCLWIRLLSLGDGGVA